MSAPSALGRIAPQDWKAAGLLVGCVLAYGCILYPVSGAAPADLAIVARIFAAAAFETAALVLVAYACLCVARPAFRAGSETRLFWLFVAALITALTFPSFGLFKQLILPTRGFLWDPTLARIGRLLTGGTSPWVFAHAVFGSHAGLRFLNFLYTFWLVLIFAFPTVVATFVTNSRLRLRLLVSWFAAWVLIGTVAAWCFASAGPCYYNALIGPDPSFAELQRHLAALARSAAAEGRPVETIEFQPFLLKAFYGRVFAPGGGISAMPSMHVALATLCAIAGYAHSRTLGTALTVYAVLIWIGSIYFGWHYLVDGPVAAVMMVAIWKATGLIRLKAGQ
ncbi:MAG TPA: phosphatase PAP2 family protein [Allosphingosinicella sp.]|nr:phosphatase PAP2 family protein [Allosphingosinicella sp.]